jgi:hypothetical protein
LAGLTFDLSHLPPIVLRSVPPLRAEFVRTSRVLVNADQRLMVIWSAKSACTAVYVWFACVSGFAEEVRAAHNRPHLHRTGTYQHSALYAKSLRFPLSKYRVLRVIRDPYLRAASSYRHALKSGYSGPYMREFSNGALGRKRGYSFRQFLAMLKTQDIERTNLHFRAQFNPIERLRKPDKVINISHLNLYDELAALERDWSLPASNLASLDWFMDRESSRKASDEGAVGDDCDQLVYNLAAANGRKPFPRYEQLLTDHARHLIEDIYAIDFAAYGEFL